jgi:hypothetical protein
MRRIFLSLAAAVGLTFGAALPASAALTVPISIDCSDGDSIPLTVDLDTLSALTSSVQAINESDTDLTCTLTQLSIPLPYVRFGNVANAASPSSGYVIGAGTVKAGCPPNNTTLFVASFAVKMYTQNGTVRGSGSLKIGSGQCVASGTLNSTPTCLAIVPTTLGGGRAWANSYVSSTTGYFNTQLHKTIGWAYEDNGPNGGTFTNDRWRVEEKPGSCPVYGDPTTDYYTLLSGDLTVRP